MKKTTTRFKKYPESFSFNPTYGERVTFKNGDGFVFTRVETELDDDGSENQYTNSAEIIKENESLMVEWNGHHYFPNEFFHYQDFEVTAVNITHNTPYENKD
jgi:hypothetical protein